ncbi:FecR domain-containing protein [Dyadobacter crusticola]|uniref:FecR domain-containing protein n=1 Tax=Dyadobacter crusticola TaxID=292407 RepID=UPI0004E1F447|nr:FecR domain-containing protein [Dyadobacter crusticola]
MSEFHDNISEELLARYLGETASEEEINAVEAWLANSPEHQQELAAYRFIWMHAAAVPRKQVDTDLGWKKVRKRMEQVAEVSAPLEVPREARQISFDQRPAAKRTFSTTILAAAAVALLALAFGWFLIKNRNAEPLTVATVDNTKEQLLPDGTKVFLNYNSSITYPEQFNGDLRTVSLQGEAFFEVKPDKAHPFIINANGTEIRVLGTSFNVKAYEKSPVRVDVATGKVQVSKASKKIELVKGEGAEVSADSIRSLQANMNIIGYRTQVFDFNAANLNEVISTIRDGYHVDVRLTNQQIAQCRLTIRFEKEPLDATLSVIAETLDLELRKEGKVYWLDGNGCQ